MPACYFKPNHNREVVCVIALTMETVQTSETSVNSYQTTRRYNPEDSHLHTHRHENLRPYWITTTFSLILSNPQPSIYSTLYHLCSWGSEVKTGKVSGSHGGYYEDGCLLCRCDMKTGRSLPTIQRFLLPPSSVKTVYNSHIDFTRHSVTLAT
jgi:hypothetical protein